MFPLSGIYSGMDEEDSDEVQGRSKPDLERRNQGRPSGLS